MSVGLYLVLGVQSATWKGDFKSFGDLEMINWITIDIGIASPIDSFFDNSSKLASNNGLNALSNLKYFEWLSLRVVQPFYFWNQCRKEADPR